MLALGGSVLVVSPNGAVAVEIGVVGAEAQTSVDGIAGGTSIGVSGSAAGCSAGAAERESPVTSIADTVPNSQTVGKARTLHKGSTSLSGQPGAFHAAILIVWRTGWSAARHRVAPSGCGTAADWPTIK